MRRDMFPEVKYADTRRQLADILTRGTFVRNEWNHLLQLFNKMDATRKPIAWLQSRDLREIWLPSHQQGRSSVPVPVALERLGARCQSSDPVGMESPDALALSADDMRHSQERQMEGNPNAGVNDIARDFSLQYVSDSKQNRVFREKVLRSVRPKIQRT